MFLQHLQRSLVDTDHSATAALGRALDPLATDDAGRALEPDLGCVQVPSPAPNTITVVGQANQHLLVCGDGDRQSVADWRVKAGEAPCAYGALISVRALPAMSTPKRRTCS